VSSSTAVVVLSPENWRSRLAHWTKGEALLQHEDQILLLLTLIIGAVVGLVVAAFIFVTENLGARMYPAGGAAWRRVLIPTGGALITGYLLSRFFTNARGSGIPQTKVALFLRDGFISLRTVAGSSDAARHRLPVASRWDVKGRQSRWGVVLFTLEEVMGDLHAPVLGSIVLGSATSWVTLHLLLGDEPLFHVPSYQLVSPIEFITYAVLGIAGGIFGPSLFIGAMLGGAVGTVAHQILPDFTGGVGAYALVGMGALFAGIVRVPLTSVIMIFEMARMRPIPMKRPLSAYWHGCRGNKSQF
jgi:H+/Cl- antiporter ClcA